MATASASSASFRPSAICRGSPTIRAIRTSGRRAYFLKVVLPFIERTYPVGTDRAARALLGFSKSGWGAWTLLLRHPDVFGRAAAWDAPMTMDVPRYGMAPIAGTQENFERYRVTTLLRERGAQLGSEPRLMLTGWDFYREQTRRRAPAAAGAQDPACLSRRSAAPAPLEQRLDGGPRAAGSCGSFAGTRASKAMMPGAIHDRACTATLRICCESLCYFFDFGLNAPSTSSRSSDAGTWPVVA